MGFGTKWWVLGSREAMRLEKTNRRDVSRREKEETKGKSLSSGVRINEKKESGDNSSKDSGCCV